MIIGRETNFVYPFYLWCSNISDFIFDGSVLEADPLETDTVSARGTIARRQR